MFEKLRGRSAPEVPPATAELQDMPPVDPHELIMDQEKSLLDSAQTWHEIALYAREQDPRYLADIQQGLIGLWNNRMPGQPLPDEAILAREAERTSKEITIYSLQATRFLSLRSHARPTDGIARAADLREYFHRIEDQGMKYLVNGAHFPRKTFVQRQRKTLTKMWTANDYTDSVLKKLTHMYTKQPEDIETLAQVYDTEAPRYDVRYRELKEMITVDWHHPDPEKSKLRSFCIQLLDKPEVFLPSFLQAVSETQGNQRMSVIQNMARFAIVAQHGADPITSQHIRRVLADTYERWNEFQDLETLFNTYVKDKAEATAAHFEAIAGPLNLKNIRMYPSEEQMERLRGNLKARFALDRSERRRLDREAKNQLHIHKLPDIDTVEQAIGNQEEEREPLPLFSCKKTPEGQLFDETTVEQFVDSLKLPP